MDRIKRLRWQQRSLPEEYRQNLSQAEMEVCFCTDISCLCPEPLLSCTPANCVAKQRVCFPVCEPHALLLDTMQSMPS